MVVVSIGFYSCGGNSLSKNTNAPSNKTDSFATSETKNIEQPSSQSNSSNDWIFGKWQVNTSELGLTTLIVNRDSTVITYGEYTEHFQGRYLIQDDVIYCFFPTENIKYPLDTKNHTIDFGQGYIGKKVAQ